MGRVAAKSFIFVISRNFQFRVSRNFLRISRNFAKHGIEIWATFGHFSKKCKKIFIFGTQCSFTHSEGSRIKKLSSLRIETRKFGVHARHITFDF